MPLRKLVFTKIESEILTWAVDGHNCAVEDESYHQDNPDDAALTPGSDPEQWPVPDVEDILYRLEVQAPDMSDDPEGIQFARNALRVARKIRASRPDGATLDTGFPIP